MRIAVATCRDLPDGEEDDRPLLAALEARGARPAVVAWDAPDVDWGAFDACLIRTTWDYTGRLDAFLAWAGRVASVTRLFNPAEVVRWNTHKAYLRELEEAGLAIVPTAWLERGSSPDLDALTSAWAGDPGRAFLKPAVGATARETLRFELARPEAAREHVARLLPEEDLLLQPYLATVETVGELSAIFVDGEPTHGVRKVPIPGDYRVQDDFGAHDERWEPGPDERRQLEPVREWLAARPEVLYARADYLPDAEGRLLLNELELVEPSLFFRHAPEAAGLLADALLARLG